MDSVGRSWYMRLTRGVLNGQVEIGTYHWSTGTQIWWTQDWSCPVDPMAQKDLADELYVALMKYLEGIS